MPSKKFKRIRKEDVPQAFDIDLVSETEVTYLPGGLDRALREASRNRHHTFRGMSWNLGGDLSVRPGDWILLPLANGEEWWLIYSSDPVEQIVVSQGGGYIRLTKPTFLRLTLDVRYNPPWEGNEGDEPRGS